jgi:hypothetical protein
MLKSEETSTQSDVICLVDFSKVFCLLFTVEQYGSGPFNRAMLMNVGAAEALKQYDYQVSMLQNIFSPTLLNK